MCWNFQRKKKSWLEELYGNRIATFLSYVSCNWKNGQVLLCLIASSVVSINWFWLLDIKEWICSRNHIISRLFNFFSIFSILSQKQSELTYLPALDIKHVSSLSTALHSLIEIILKHTFGFLTHFNIEYFCPWQFPL